MWARILVLGHLGLGAWFVYAGEWVLIPIVPGWLPVLRQTP